MKSSPFTSKEWQFRTPVPPQRLLNVPAVPVLCSPYTANQFFQAKISAVSLHVSQSLPLVLASGVAMLKSFPPPWPRFSQQVLGILTPKSFHLPGRPLFGCCVSNLSTIFSPLDYVVFSKWTLCFHFCFLMIYSMSCSWKAPCN